MTIALPIALIAVMLAGGLWLLISKAAYDSTLRMREPERRLVDPARPETDEFRAAAEETGTWAVAHGFAPEDRFDFLVGGPVALQCASWRHEASGTVLCLYVAPTAVMTDFVTMYRDACTVSTSSSRDSLLLPTPPDVFVQAFPGQSLEALLGRHREATGAVEATRRLPRPELPGPTRQLIAETMRRHVAYVTALTLWPLRAPIWYFGRRYALANRPVATRVQRVD
jgi:hypothetical protein